MYAAEKLISKPDSSGTHCGSTLTELPDDETGFSEK
jgi:hypothetical protein